MCLAPCFAGCSKEEYAAEVSRLVEYLESDGGSLRNQFEVERDRASEDLDFERASAIHKKLEKLDDVLRGKPDLPRKIEKLDAVILQKSAEEHTVGVYTIRRGRLAEPFFLRFGEMASAPGSAEQLLRSQVEKAEQVNVTNDLSESLWLISRWFYSKPRDGEIFFRDQEWPYRRIMRACSRLLAPSEEPPKEPRASG